MTQSTVRQIAVDGEIIDAKTLAVGWWLNWGFAEADYRRLPRRYASRNDEV